MIFKNLKQSNKLALSGVSSLHNDLDPSMTENGLKINMAMAILADPSVESWFD